VLFQYDLEQIIEKQAFIIHALKVQGFER